MKPIQGELAEFADTWRAWRNDHSALDDQEYSKNSPVGFEDWPGNGTPVDLHEYTRHLEAAGAQEAAGSGVSAEHLAAVSGTLGVGLPLLMPFASEPVDGPLVEPWRAWDSVEFAFSAEHGAARMGAICIPTRRLRGSWRNPVAGLSLPPGGRSISHRHFGDELLLVLDGEVRVRLADHGMAAELRPADFVQFYGEQWHCLENVSATAPAWVLALRMYPPTARTKLVEATRRRSLVEPLEARAIAEFRENVTGLAPFTAKSAAGMPFLDPEAEIVDRHGLAAFLRNLLEQGELASNRRAPSLEQLSRKSNNKRYNARLKLHRLHNAAMPVYVQELPEIAKIHGIETFLLCDFLFPAVRSANAIHQAWDDLPPPFGKSDWVEIPLEYQRRTPEATKARYTVPRRRLADSSLSIAIVELPGLGDGTPDNRHPGIEHLVPISGQVEIRFRESQTVATVREGDVATFRSNRDHRIVNVGAAPAKFWVLRTYF